MREKLYSTSVYGCELQVSEGKPPLSLLLFFHEVMGSHFHCVCSDQETMPKIALGR